MMLGVAGLVGLIVEGWMRRRVAYDELAFINACGKGFATHHQGDV